MSSSKGLSGEAYEKFKQGLLNRDITLGATMSQSELAEILSVSLGPLRNALKLLEAEGFLEILPRSGIRIAEPDIDLVKNCYQLRRIIEQPALEKFAEHTSRQELEAVKAVHLEILSEVMGRSELSSGLFERARTIDTGFHRQMVASLDNPIIDSIYQTNHQRALLIRLRKRKDTVAFVITTFEEHLRIIDALLESDTDRAAAALNQHLDKAIQRALGF
ncbi:MAG: GntR family transcriptional regulator [Pseudomonadota bacterium]